MLTLKIIMGSARPGRFSEHVAPWLAGILGQRTDVAIETIDLRDYPMPFYDQPISPSKVNDGAYANDVVRAFAGKIREADAFVVIAPEYNHGYPAVLKNALDSVYAEWNNKAVAFVAYGNAGGARSVEQLRGVSVELQMAPIRSAVHIPMPWLLLEENGSLKTGALDAYEQVAQKTIDQLVWWGEALKNARQNH
ncbi:MAG TPA: NAD(P)H-dependent oxidoreductase [Candidatus Paceibacterota bacterium]